MVEPLSITVGCVGLLSSVVGLSQKIATFVRDIRESRKDMEAVSRELASLTICLEMLRSDCDNPSVQYPVSFRENLINILRNCDTVIIEIRDLMQKISTASLGGRLQWAVTGQDDLTKLRLRLEAHKGAIDVALDMLQILLIREVKEDTTNILNDTHAIRQDTSRIPQIQHDVSQIPKLVAEISMLKLQVETLARPGSPDSIVIRRFLEDTVSYADSEYDDAMSYTDNFSTKLDDASLDPSLNMLVPGLSAQAAHDKVVGDGYDDANQSHELLPSANGRNLRNEEGENPKLSTSGSSMNYSQVDGAVKSGVKQANSHIKPNSNWILSKLLFKHWSQPSYSLWVTSSPSPYHAWSMRQLTYTASHPRPFPRYGAATNSVASKEGDIYVMGGLINNSTVKADLWVIKAREDNMACYPVATIGVGPGPRVGHAGLLVGNAFIVYGGGSKVDGSDFLDETLYILNTTTSQWSRAVPAAGPGPSGRYCHSLNILGTKIYIFGGLNEGIFMSDLFAFDLNQLKGSSNRWEMLNRNHGGGEMPLHSVPTPRANHSMVGFNEKLYLFGGVGGANGIQWFNDVWSYDPLTNAWTQLDCTGHIPEPREGHTASLVDDIMYIFGGRNEKGADLGDLAAFRMTSRRWFAFPFQNMGPFPSPRSGQSMTRYGQQIIVFAGEPSDSNKASDLTSAYVLDTTKIRHHNLRTY